VPQAVSYSISNLVPATIYHFRVATTNSVGASLGQDQTFVTLSTNADLLSLTSTGGALSPPFNRYSTNYSQTVVPGSIIMLTPTAVDSNATLQVRVNAGSWGPILSGSPTAPLDLAPGGGAVVNILVTAQDGVTTRIYSVGIGMISGGVGLEFWTASFAPGVTAKPVNDVAIRHDGTRGPQVFVVSGQQLYALDNATGFENWSYTGTATLNRPVAARLPSGIEAIFVTSRDGILNGINGENGLPIWSPFDTKRKSGTGTTLCPNDKILAPAAVQLYDDSNAAFRSAISDDLIIVCTAYDANCNSGYTANRIYGFKATSRAIAWTFNLFGQEADYFSGSCTIDSQNNILYAGSNQPTGGAQPTLWQISTLDGSLIASRNWGSIRNKPVLAGDRLYVADYAGTLYAISTNLLTEIWSLQVTISGYLPFDPEVVRPCGDSQNLVLIADSSGRVHAIRDLGTNAVVAWPPALLGEAPSRPVALPALGKAFFSVLIGSEAWVYQIALATGSVEAGVELGPGEASEPAPDSSGNLLVDSMTVARSGYLNRLAVPLQPVGGFGATNDSVRITKSASSKTAIAGQPITYNLLINNLDRTAFMTDVVVTDFLPTGMTNAILTTSQGTVATVQAPACVDLISSRSDSGLEEVSTSGYQVRAVLGTLTNQTSASVTVTVTPSQVGFLTNTAYAVADQTLRASSTNGVSTAIVQVLDPAADDDADGISNLQEYLAGTDPLNPNSVFRITSINHQTNDVAVTWTTVGGRKYELEAVGGLGNSFNPVSPVISIPGDGESTTNFVENGVGTAPGRHYRVRLVP